MDFPTRTLSGVCEISTASFLISSMPKAHEGENGAIDVIVQFRYKGEPYPADSLKAEMYLFFQSQNVMTDAVDLTVNSDIAIGSIPAELIPRAGCPLLVITLSDPSTGQQIVACHIPVHVDNVLGNTVMTARPPTPSEVVYVGRAPYIGDNGNWHIFDNKMSAFIDSGIQARGPQGPAGPAGSVTAVTIGGTKYEPDDTGIVELPETGGGVPDGGTTGQMLFKTGDEDGAAEWQTPTHDKVGALGSDPRESEEESPEMSAVPINADQLGGFSLAEIMLKLYPVGAIYTSTVETSPASLFGGTWEQLKDRFLLGAGDTYAAGSMDGEAEVSLTDPAQNAPHRHDMIKVNESYKLFYESTGEETSGASAKLYAGGAGLEGGIYTSISGAGEPHNNMPPYLAVYMWKRVS